MIYDVQYHDELFEVKTYGDAELKVFIDLWKKLVTHEKWKSDSHILLDHSELNCGPLTASEIQTIAGIAVSMNIQIGKTKLAVVVAHDLEYGMVRMRQVYVEGKWDVVEQVFRSREEALSWLKEG